ncbi:hypothetical protein OF83DRAFT_1052586 [Amylostereum chailletii]|nr:hypothetical protein OF83DRAFT_1052586 [Amylostereum chailletii]
METLPEPFPERPPSRHLTSDTTEDPRNDPAPIVSSSPGPPSRPQSPEQENSGSRPSSPHSTAGSAAPSASASTSSAPSLTGGWAIWSRRPDDPARAPGIIISPRACPPKDVIQRALQISTPPPSPPGPIIALPDALPPDEAKTENIDDSPRNQTDVLSSSTTDVSTAPDTPMPGSPLSTNTSVSVAETASKADSKSPTSPKLPIDAPVVVEEATPTEEPSTTSSDPAPTTESSTSTSVPAPVPAVKKSWASLLRPAGGTPSKGALPTSSVVGFSVPASPPPTRVLPVRRPELLSILSGSVPASAPPVIRPRGLVNLGNMCFANAVLQLLVYCPPFWRLFNELGKALPEGVEGEGATPLGDATVRFLKEFVPEQKKKGGKKGKEVEEPEEEGLSDSFIPTYVYDAMKEKKRFDNMRGGHQEDAEEFFGFYLDTLEEELLSLSSTLNPKAQAPLPKVEEHEEETPHEEGWMEVGKRNKTVLTRTVKSVESPITRIFGGKFRSTLRAPQQRDSVVVEDWRSLQLDIQKDSVNTIRDALSHISQPQSVQIVSPTRPGTTVDATQQVFIEALPPILVLHLKRFLYDTDAKGVMKIGKKVQFTPELDIPNGSDIMAPGKRSHPTRYQLYGVLYHHGLSASGGHYTLDVLHPNRDMNTSGGRPREAWIRIDDELVSDVRPEDVFGGYEQDDRCAYLLFYRRVAVWGRPT